MKVKAVYPSKYHRSVSEHIVDLFSQIKHVEAIILTCSCARGKGKRDIDFCILTSPDLPQNYTANLENRWRKKYQEDLIFTEFREQGKFYQVDLCFTDGNFFPQPRTLSLGPDDFELKIGNTYIYTVPIWERNSYFRKKKSKWLPFYNERLRKERLDEAIRCCNQNIEYIAWFNTRKLYFQAFKRLYTAISDFQQALFISRKKYPIAYDKWIQEQLEEILHIKGLYLQLLKLIEIKDIKSFEVVDKGRKLRRLLEDYIP